MRQRNAVVLLVVLVLTLESRICCSLTTEESSKDGLSFSLAASFSVDGNFFTGCFKFIWNVSYYNITITVSHLGRTNNTELWRHTSRKVSRDLEAELVTKRLFRRGVGEFRT